MPWDRVLTLNQTLCENQKKSSKDEQIAHELREPAGQQARDLWVTSVAQRLTLPEALDVCRRCCDLAPFRFNNGNTFASAGKALLEDWLSTLPSVEAQIARTTIGHYVADHMVTRRELIKVLKHFEARWKINGYERDLATPAPIAEVQTQPQPGVSQA